MFFIKENIAQIIYEAFGYETNKIFLCWVAFAMFAALCLIRKIEIFAPTHLFADAMIVITLIAVIVYGMINISNEGHANLNTVSPINSATFADAIGYSVYSYEGIGVILPVG